MREQDEWVLAHAYCSGVMCVKAGASLPHSKGWQPLLEAVVFFQDGAEFFVVEGGDVVAVNAGHGVGGDHGVDDGFFGGLDYGGEDGVEGAVRNHFYVGYTFGTGCAGVGGGESDEDVAGAVAGDAAEAAEAEGGAVSEALELRGD